jgi:hypothetical protein
MSRSRRGIAPPTVSIITYFFDAPSSFPAVRYGLDWILRLRAVPLLLQFRLTDVVVVCKKLLGESPINPN